MRREPADTDARSLLPHNIFAPRRLIDVTVCVLMLFTFLMSSRNAALSPLNLTPCGPERLRLASTRSSLREDRHLAKTASPETKRREGGEGGAEEGRHLKPVKSNTETEMIAESHKHDSALLFCQETMKIILAI